MTKPQEKAKRWVLGSVLGSALHEQQRSLSSSRTLGSKFFLGTGAYVSKNYTCGWMSKGRRKGSYRVADKAYISDLSRRNKSTIYWYSWQNHHGYSSGQRRLVLYWYTRGPHPHTFMSMIGGRKEWVDDTIWQKKCSKTISKNNRCTFCINGSCISIECSSSSVLLVMTSNSPVARRSWVISCLCTYDNDKVGHHELKSGVADDFVKW